MRLRQLIENDDTNDNIPSSGLIFTRKSANRYVVTHERDGILVFNIQKDGDGYWHVNSHDGSLVIPPKRSLKAVSQSAKQFYDDREEMSEVGMHPNTGKADEIAKHLFDVLKANGKDGIKAVQKEFQMIIDRDKPRRWEISVIKNKFLALANPSINEASIKALKKNKQTLTSDERDSVNAADLESTIWKSVDPKTGKTTYVASTHRATDTASTLKGAISKAKSFIDSTS